MLSILLNTIALDPNRWTPTKQPYTHLETVLDRVVASGFRQLEVWQYHLSTLDAAATDALVVQAQRLGVTAPIVGVYPALHLEGELRDQQWASWRPPSSGRSAWERAPSRCSRVLGERAGECGGGGALGDVTRQLIGLAADHENDAYRGGPPGHLVRQPGRHTGLHGGCRG